MVVGGGDRFQNNFLSCSPDLIFLNLLVIIFQIFVQHILLHICVVLVVEDADVVGGDAPLRGLLLYLCHFVDDLDERFFVFYRIGIQPIHSLQNGWGTLRQTLAMGF